MKSLLINGLIVTEIEENDGEFVCDYTGEVLTTGQRFVCICGTDDKIVSYNYCDENFERFGVCADCGHLIDLEESEWWELEDGDYICRDCFETGDYIVCEDCGCVVRYDDSVEIHTSDSRCFDNPFYVCSDCASRNYYQCDECGEWYKTDGDFVTTRDGDYICWNCYEDGYCTCEDCGEVVPSDEGGYDENDYWCCDECLERHSTIGSYHSHSRYNWNKYNINGVILGTDLELPENQKLTGIELEVERANSSESERNADAKEMIAFMDGRVHCEHDCSLRDGYEYIFDPHTPEAFKSLPLREMLEKLKAKGYTSHDNGDCGLHIHFSNEWFGDTSEEMDDNIAKVMHLYSEEYDFFLKCSRRTESQAHEWARKFDCDDFNDAKAKKGGSWGHEVAINLGGMDEGTGTVEFRLGRGTLKYESLMAWYDMHVAIARNVKNIEPNDIDLNKWLDGITEETKAYIFERTGKAVA